MRTDRLMLAVFYSVKSYAVRRRYRLLPGLEFSLTYESMGSDECMQLNLDATMEDLCKPRTMCAPSEPALDSAPNKNNGHRHALDGSGMVTCIAGVREYDGLIRARDISPSSPKVCPSITPFILITSSCKHNGMLPKFLPCEVASISGELSCTSSKLFPVC